MITKTYLYDIIVGDFYRFKVFEVVDAQKQVYYIGERINYGGTKLADSVEELREKLESEVPILNSFLRRVR